MRPFMASHVSPEDFSPSGLKMLSSRETCPRVSSKWCSKADASSCEASASAIFGKASTSCVSALYKLRNSSTNRSRKEFNFNAVNLIANMFVSEPERGFPDRRPKRCRSGEFRTASPRLKTKAKKLEASPSRRSLYGKDAFQL